MVESFKLDHTKVVAPYVRLAERKVGPKGDIVSKFDLRLVQPNQEAISTGAIHTLEHLLAVNIRDLLDNVIDISPMGCRTGFYLLVFGEPELEQIQAVLIKLLEIVTKTEEVPATTAKECGHYRDHSLFGAKEYAKIVLEKWRSA